MDFDKDQELEHNDPGEIITSLPPGQVRQTYRVLVEWFREDRRMRERRIDGMEEKLEKIFLEARRTNGRVDGIESRERERKAYADGRTRQERLTDEALEKQYEKEERRRDRWTNAGFIVLGGVAGGLGHHFGIW